MVLQQHVVEPTSFLACLPVLAHVCETLDCVVDRPFHQLQSPKVEVFLTRDRGWGVKAAELVAKGSFIVEYAGKCLHLMMPSIPQFKGTI